MVVFPVAVTNSSLSFIFRCWCVIHVLISNVRSLQVRNFPSLIFGKKIPDYVHPWGEFSIQNVVLSVNRRKQPKIFTCETFFVFWTKCSSKCPNSTKPHLPWKISDWAPVLSHWKLINNFSILLIPPKEGKLCKEN